MQVTIDRVAHGGYGIAQPDPDTKTIFVRGGLPGDILDVSITSEKKNVQFATIEQVITPGEYRIADPGQYRCPAAIQGAGCCDFSAVDAQKETALKIAVATDQLRRIAGMTDTPIEVVPIDTTPGWRTRLRLGVDADGRAGLRAQASHRIVTAHCSAADPRLYETVEGLRFTPGAEVTAVVDSDGDTHVVESSKPARGRRVGKPTRIYAGGPTATMRVGEDTFELAPTGFWQAHKDLPEIFSGLIDKWFFHAGGSVGWDLYGGAGALAPALWRQLDHSPDADAIVVSVDTSQPKSSTLSQAIRMVRGRVDDVVTDLPRPDLIVLDPPRTGAGSAVVAQCAQAGPRSVLHFACDPATGARDLASWMASGYHTEKVWLVNAFPASHHFELVFGLKRTETD